MAFAPAAVPVVITSILFTSIAFITVVLRLWTRLVVLHNAGADDYLMAASMVRDIRYTWLFIPCKY